MKKLTVLYCGWGERWRLGQLAHSGRRILFEYSPEALERGLEPSRLRVPLRREAYADLPEHLHLLPGFIADALPDGWGWLLMDRVFQRNGIDPAAVSPLDRLALLGERAMGALAFEPATNQVLTTRDTTLLKLARQVETVLAGKDTDVLEDLLLRGGSPHGARPKILAYFNPQARTIHTAPAEAHQPFLFKFPAQNEHPEVCAVEHVYCETARSCGLKVPTTYYLSLDAKHSAFGIARFDLEAGLRVPILTLAGALHADFRLPSLDYMTFLRATRALTLDESEVARAYERAVFNILFHNRDDHSKNFAFRLSRDLHWRLAPAYDLTFCEGPGGEHQMTVGGEGRKITREHLLDLAKTSGLKAQVANASLERMFDAVPEFAQRLHDAEIRSATVKSVLRHVERNRRALAARSIGPGLAEREA
jgi:serine/threonine-protein kinase HipA